MLSRRLKEFEGSIREVSRLAGVSHSTVIGIRDGAQSPTVRTVDRIEKALDLLTAIAEEKQKEQA